MDRKWRGAPVVAGRSKSALQCDCEPGWQRPGDSTDVAEIAERFQGRRNAGLRRLCSRTCALDRRGPPVIDTSSRTLVAHRYVKQAARPGCRARVHADARAPGKSFAASADADGLTAWRDARGEILLDVV